RSAGDEVVRIAVGADHAGFELKQTLKQHLTRERVALHDFGTTSPEPADYPEFAQAVAQAVVSGKADVGILVCGTGIGVSMAANKVPGARAALCMTEDMARLARAHNNANILCL